MSTTAMNTIFKQPLALPSVSWFLEKLPVVVLILCIAFLQGFSLQFWAELLGSVGWGISIGLEVIHLWAWYRAAVSVGTSRFAWILLAIAATGLLLASAVHEIAQPLLQESARIEAADQQRESLEAEARVLNANLTAFRDMAAVQGRRGWRDDIRRDTARLQAITERLRYLAAYSSDRPHLPWLNQITRWGVVAVALLFQLAAVLAIWTLSRSSQQNGSPKMTVAATQPERCTVAATSAMQSQLLRKQSQQPQREFYGQLWGRIEAHARSNSTRLARANGKIVQAYLARDLGITPPDFTGIKMLAQGKQVSRIPAREAIEKLAARFEIAMPN